MVKSPPPKMVLKVVFYGLSFLLFVGCALEVSPDPPELIEERLIYKPFASDHDDKFSLGDFDSPYLLQLADGMADFAIGNGSRVLLNGVAYGVVKTDYQGGTYLGIAGFSFSEYANFTKANAEANLQISLVLANRNAIVMGAISNSLVVSDPSAIYTWQDLQAMKHNLIGEYELRNDITFPDRGSEGLPMEGFEPVGDGNVDSFTGEVIGDPFTGSFAGGGHTIANLSIDRDDRDKVGIWGVVDGADSVIKDFVLDHGGIRGAEVIGGVVGALNNGMVNNVGVVSSQDRSISGSDFVGGLVGMNFFGGTANGYATGTVAGNDFIGGLVGQNEGIVTGYATGTVAGNNFIGGLVGLNNQGIVSGYTIGAVAGTRAAANVGGLVGLNGEGIVTGYATGAVFGVTNVGGLVGANVETETSFGTGAIVTGYATGAVTGVTNVGGLVGQNDGTGIVTGYATGSVTGNFRAGGLVGLDSEGTVTGYWDLGSTEQMNGFGINFVGTTFTGAGISSITNVTYDSTAGTYTDTKGTGAAGDDIVVFDNMAFTNSFVLPGVGSEWPILRATP